MSRVFVARKSGTCPECREPITEGKSRIVQDTMDSKYKHADCVFGKKTHEASPINPPAATPPREAAGQHASFYHTKAALPGYPSPLTKGVIEEALVYATAKAEELSGELNLTLTEAIFRAAIAAQEQQFSVAFSKVVAQEKDKEQQNKLANIKSVREAIKR